MTRSSRTTTILLLAVTAGLATTSPAGAGSTVSPGETDRFAAVELRCPTFSWEAAPGADAFELVAFSLPPGLEPDQILDQDLGPEAEVLSARVAGGATAWTPPADRCLEPGGRYAWFVRPVAGDEPGAWSGARFFSLPEAPSEAELRQALAVLERWSAAGGQAVGAEAARPPAVARSAPASGGLTGTPAPKSVPTASAAIRGDSVTPTGEAYGVIGTSTSPDGAGLAAANTAGGYDLVLDGSAHYAADTLVSEGGINRRSPADQEFWIRNSGGGAMLLAVEGGLEADALSCPGCVGSDEIADGTVGTADLAVNAVDSTRILNASVQTHDLADDVINTNKIIDGAVRTDDLLANAVTGAKIADGTVRTADLADDAVTSAKIADGSVTAADVDPTSSLYVSKTQLYERESSETWTYPGSIKQIEVECDDANDLPVAGFCETDIGQ